jgi:hypothetical protein
MNADETDTPPGETREDDPLRDVKPGDTVWWADVELAMPTGVHVAFEEIVFDQSEPGTIAGMRLPENSPRREPGGDRIILRPYEVFHTREAALLAIVAQLDAMVAEIQAVRDEHHRMIGG